MSQGLANRREFDIHFSKGFHSRVLLILCTHAVCMQLLSLRGRQEVKVRELSLAVQVTQGQVKGQPQASHGGSAVASTGSLPPMMQSLVASLKLLSVS